MNQVPNGHEMYNWVDPAGHAVTAVVLVIADLVGPLSCVKVASSIQPTTVFWVRSLHEMLDCSISIAIKQVGCGCGGHLTKRFGFWIENLTIWKTYTSCRTKPLRVLLPFRSRRMPQPIAKAREESEPFHKRRCLRLISLHRLRSSSFENPSGQSLACCYPRVITVLRRCCWAGDVTRARGPYFVAVMLLCIWSLAVCRISGIAPLVMPQYRTRKVQRATRAARECGLL